MRIHRRLHRHELGGLLCVRYILTALAFLRFCLQLECLFLGQRGLSSLVLPLLAVREFEVVPL